MPRIIRVEDLAVIAKGKTRKAGTVGKSAQGLIGNNTSTGSSARELPDGDFYEPRKKTSKTKAYEDEDEGGGGSCGTCQAGTNKYLDCIPGNEMYA